MSTRNLFINQTRDGITPLFLEVGANPRTSPGVDLPIGSLVKYGTVYYRKHGSSATNWTKVAYGTRYTVSVAEAMSTVSGLDPADVLRIRFQGQVEAAGSRMHLQINGAGTGLSSSIVVCTGGTATGSVGTDDFEVGFWNSGSTNTVWGTIDILSIAGQVRGIEAEMFARNSTTKVYNHVLGDWDSAAAITSIGLGDGVAKNQAGFTIDVYGLPIPEIW